MADHGLLRRSQFNRLVRIRLHFVKDATESEIDASVYDSLPRSP